MTLVLMAIAQFVYAFTPKMHAKSLRTPTPFYTLIIEANNSLGFRGTTDMA